MRKRTLTVSMDTKQRICLTRVLTKEERENFNNFRMYRSDGKIVLEPLIEIPAKNHWLYKNPEALISLLKGIKDVERGKVHDLGSFAQHAQEGEEGTK